ncbi:hypothetical protein PMM47T1_10005 [Pseudomonas sp. M47T1]|uniref:hypothetical protein n=1 Tax=unclassified Pseudomonas TaxID=196821 RepID=UPI0002606F0F|nr:hypothetical protein [Pseudomonas sp. M47T1]EIK96598.1 hypothetical protein PMM47T1_10005 [Pseudomonas sp. M47T1]
MKGPLVALLALALVTGSAMAAPRAADDEGMFRPATQVSAVALHHSQSVGVILNEQTQAALMHRNAATRAALEAVRASLQQQFANVQFYSSLDKVLAARPDVIVVLKSANQHGGFVQAQFFDSNLTYITEARGVNAQQAGALRAFDASLKALVASAD